MNKFILICLLSLSATAGAWDKVFSCDSHALVLDVKNFGRDPQHGNFSQYQAVVNDVRIANYFRESGVQTRSLPDGRMIFENLFKVGDGTFRSHNRSMIVTLKKSRDSRKATITVKSQSDSIHWQFNHCQ